MSALGTRNTRTAVSMPVGGPQDDATMRTVPTQLSAPASASTTAIADALPSPPVSQHHKKRRRYTYIGKRPKAWGRLVSVPDPEEQQQQRQAQRKKKGPRKRKRAGRVRVRLFVGSEEPLLLARKKQRAKRRRRRRRDVSPAAASLSVPTSSPVRVAAAADGEVNEEADEEADGGLDEGVWPGEYAVPLPLGVVAAAAAVGKRTTTTMTTTNPNSRAVLRITPEVVQRAIGAALAVGGQ